MVDYKNYIKYPNSLPNPQSDFSGTLQTPTQTTSFTSGKIRRRKIGRTAVKKSTLNWLLTPDEFDLFEIFYVDGIGAGISPFVINMCTGGSSQTGDHVVQLVADPSFSHEECNWRVSVECIIYPYPRKDVSDLLELYLGAPVSDFTAIINHYYEQDYQQ